MNWRLCLLNIILNTNRVNIINGCNFNQEIRNEQGGFLSPHEAQRKWIELLRTPMCAAPPVPESVLQLMHHVWSWMSMWVLWESQNNNGYFSFSFSVPLFLFPPLFFLFWQYRISPSCDDDLSRASKKAIGSLLANKYSYSTASIQHRRYMNVNV